MFSLAGFGVEPRGLTALQEKQGEAVNRKFSLKKNRDFQYVYRRGKAFHCQCMTLLVARGREQDINIGISASKKVGNAVVRNRIKRRIRESIRPHLPQMETCKKIIIVVRPCIAGWSYQQIEREMARLLHKSSLLRPGE